MAVKIKAVKPHYVLLRWPVSCSLRERTLWMRPQCRSLAHAQVTVNGCCSVAFPSAWRSLVLCLPSIAVTCVLKAVISTLCSIATMSSSPLLYFPQFSQACGCLSVEADSPVFRFSCLTPCCSATTFWLRWDISLSIRASARPHSLQLLVLLNLMNQFQPILKHLYSTFGHTWPNTLLFKVCVCVCDL